MKKSFNKEFTSKTQNVKISQFRDYNLPNTKNLKLWALKIYEVNGLLNKNSIFQYAINFLIVIFLGFILYRFYLGLNSDYLSFLWGSIPSFFFSFLISSFVLNKFKYSKNLIIRLLQKFCIFNLCLISGYFILYFVLDVNFSIFADSDGDSDAETAEENGKAKSPEDKAVSTIGLGIGQATIKNNDLFSSIDKSKNMEPNISRVPSPNNDNSIINCIIENRELSSPLEDILLYQFLLNILILLLIIILLIIIFNRFVLKSNLNLLSSIFDKYMPTNLNELFKKSVNYSNVYNNRFLFIIYIVISIVLILIILLNIITSAELLVNCEKYIEVYNYLHNKK